VKSFLAVINSQIRPIALLGGPRQGWKVFTLQILPARDPEDRYADTVGKMSGFALHAGVAHKAEEWNKLERLRRYVSRPAVSEKLLLLTPGGNVRCRRSSLLNGVW
jgi:hypothetical protein